MSEIEKASAPRDVGSFVRSDGFRAAVAAALPRMVSPERFCRQVVTAVNRLPALAGCTLESLRDCVMDCAQLGLEPSTPLGLAYLIPYQDRKRGITVCTLIVGYRGLVELAYRSGKVRSIRAEVVHERDVFQVRKGLHPDLIHEPTLVDDPGAMTHVYAVAHVEGVDPAWTVMTRREVDAIRTRSPAGQSGPWVTDYEEMARKTTVRRLAKLLPLTTEVQDAIGREDDRMEAAGVYAEVSRPTASITERVVAEESRQVLRDTLYRQTAPVEPSTEAMAPAPDPAPVEPPPSDDPSVGARDRLVAEVAKLPRPRATIFRQKVLYGKQIEQMSDVDALGYLEVLRDGDW